MTYGSVTYTHGYVERRMRFMARYEHGAVSALAYSCGSRQDVVDTVDIHLDERGVVLRDLCAVCDALGLVLSAAVSCATKDDYASKKEKYAALGFVQKRVKVNKPSSVIKQRTLIVRFVRTPGERAQPRFGANVAVAKRRTGQRQVALSQNRERRNGTT